ncbi:hypothetical protein [Nocardioides sp. NPDC006273]|uniref:hypothetical protein n=1 Tax=Nocardioides sp. NPDC006273 TaxID=3155598 RepID=UPI0033A5DAD7
MAQAREEESQRAPAVSQADLKSGMPVEHPACEQAGGRQGGLNRHPEEGAGPTALASLIAAFALLSAVCVLMLTEPRGRSLLDG